MLANVRALIANFRAYIAELRNDANGTSAFAAKALAELNEGERLVDSMSRWNRAAADWLCGRLAEAERVFVPSVAGRQAAGLPTWSAWGSYELAQVQRAQGRRPPPRTGPAASSRSAHCGHWRWPPAAMKPAR